MRHDPRISKSAITDVYARSGRVCEDCGYPPPSLEMHHLTYQKWVYPFEGPKLIHGFEEFDDLALLCRHCHHARHIGPISGAFFTDPEEADMERRDINEWENDK